MEKLKDLQQKVLDWSAKNGITINGKITTQTFKLISEKSEISEALLENSAVKLTDAIGDCFVVLINIAELARKELEKENIKYNFDITELKACTDCGGNILKLDVLFGNFADDVGKGVIDIRDHIKNIAECILGLADINAITLEEALGHAYNEIKDRVGFLTPEGNFIKSTDPRYEEIIKKYGK